MLDGSVENGKIKCTKNKLRKEGSGEVGKNKKGKCLNSQRKKDAEKHQKNIDIRSSCTTLKP